MQVAYIVIQSEATTMANIYALPERPETRIRKRREATRALAIELRRNAIGNAYDYVLRNHPEITEVEEQFELAVELAIAALYTGAKDLTDEPPGIVSYLRLAIERDVRGWRIRRALRNFASAIVIGSVLSFVRLRR